MCICISLCKSGWLWELENFAKTRFKSLILKIFDYKLRHISVFFVNFKLCTMIVQFSTSLFPPFEQLIKFPPKKEPFPQSDWPNGGGGRQWCNSWGAEFPQTFLPMQFLPTYWEKRGKEKRGKNGEEKKENQKRKVGN